MGENMPHLLLHQLPGVSTDEGLLNRFAVFGFFAILVLFLVAFVLIRVYRDTLSIN
jgi:hypothetical protein